MSNYKAVLLLVLISYNFLKYTWLTVWVKLLERFVVLAHDCDAVAVTPCSVSWLCPGVTAYLWHQTCIWAPLCCWVALLWLLSQVALLVKWIYMVLVLHLSSLKVCCRCSLPSTSWECRKLLKTHCFILVTITLSWVFTHSPEFSLVEFSSSVNFPYFPFLYILLAVAVI